MKGCLLLQQQGEKSLSTTLPVLTVPAVIPLCTENMLVKELGLCDQADNQCWAELA